MLSGMAEKVVVMQIKLAAVLARMGTQPVNVAALCAVLGISRTSFYKYKARFEAVGIEGLLPQSRRPRRSPGRIGAEVEEGIVGLRKELADAGWDNGAVSIRYAMLAAGGAAPAVSTIHRVLRRHGLVVDQPAKRPRASYRRFEFPAAGDCWQIDAFVWQLADGATVTIFQIIDDHSRLETDSFAAASESGVAAWACWLRAIERHGVPAMVLSDNGSAFSGARRGWTADFERNVRALGTRTITSTPSHPQTCGKDERFHQTLQKWLSARAPQPPT
jgi:transposase InsO family protein